MDQSARILIIDDEPRNLRLIEAMLKPEGHRTLTAANAVAALEMVATQAPDLILLDVMLPDMSGFEVASQLKANPATKGIPIIMITALDDRDSRLAGLNAGAEEFITKPVDRPELLVRVRNLLRLKEYSDFLADHNRIQERQRLEEEIIEISDHEQQRIGRDLHDSVCQQLTGIELMSHALKKALTHTARNEAELAGQVAHYTRDAISEVRMIARGLCPVIVEADGLMSTLPQLAETITRMFKVACDFRCPAPVLIDDNNLATNLYRIAQEAVSNAIKHGRARTIEIHLASDAQALSLTIRDDGLGLPAQPIRSGLGLGIMQYRTNMIGGNLVIEPRSEGGTVVVCRVPRPTVPAV